MSLNPQEHLRKYSQVYPGVLETIDELRAKKRKLGDWPNWCYCPLAGTYAAISKFVEDNPKLVESDISMVSFGVDLGNITAIAAWRKTKGIYKFDETLLREIIKTEITGDIPADIIKFLPEWCIYVELPKGVLDDRIVGFFAYLEYDVNTKGEELRIVLDLGKTLTCLIVHLVGSLKEGLKESMRVSRNVAIKELGMDVPELEEDDLYEYLSKMGKFLSGYVCLILYICSQNSEIRNTSNKPGLPKNPKPEKSGKVFTSDQIKTWEVGFRVGVALRAAQEKLDQDDPEKETQVGEHARPKPHIRRAHWHSYWTGAKPNQKPVLRWLSPILVNVSDDNSNITTLRIVD